MAIIWNKVTWYSKLAAVIFFLLIVPVLTFYIGAQYEKTIAILDQSNIFPMVSNENLSDTQASSLNSVCEGNTAAQLSDVTDPSASPSFNWLSTSSIEVEQGAGIFVRSSSDSVFYTVPLSTQGKAWRLIATSSRISLGNFGQPLFNFDESFYPWQDSIIVGDLKLSPTEADGTWDLNPGFSGLIRDHGNCVQFVELSSIPVDYVEESTGSDPGDLPEIEPVSPYRYQYDIFVSNWIPLSVILNSIQAKDNQDN